MPRNRGKLGSWAERVRSAVVSGVVLGIMVVGGIVLAGVLISRAADREQHDVDDARAAARPTRATIVEVASTNSAVTSPGVRREGHRFVLDLVDDDPSAGTDRAGDGSTDDGGQAAGAGAANDAGGRTDAEPRRVTVVWYVPAMAVPQLQPGEVVPVVADPRDDRLTWCEVDGVEPDRHALVQALRGLH